MSNSPFSSNAEETRSAIAAFEQILDAFPEDVTTLEALYQAHDSLGHVEEARKYILRTAQAIERQPGEPGVAATSSLLEHLRSMAPQDREAERLMRAMESRVRSEPHPASAASPSPRNLEITRGMAMEAEMALAWKLKEANWIPEKDYAQLVQDLTEISASDNQNTLSLLHAMQDRGIPNFENILVHIARDAGVGILPITSFDPHPDALGLLPTALVLRQGIVLFDLIGSEALAAILNPYNEHLRTETERISGKKCHFYLTPPTEFDSFTARLRDNEP